MPPCIMVSLHLAIAFFCFVFFSLGKKDKFRRNNGCVKSCYTYQEPLPTWSEEDNNIQFTLQVCFLWHFQSSFRFIYLYVTIHKGFSSLWMCGISLWWIMFTLQFMTNKSLVVFYTTSSTWCLIPMLKCNDMLQTCILCPWPQLSFVFFFSTTSSIA